MSVRKLWVTLDPTPTSRLGDCCFETTTAGFVLQVRGGLDAERHPEIHETHDHALQDLERRCFHDLETIRNLHREVQDAIGAPSRRPA